MSPFLPGYEPGTWVQILTPHEMLQALQRDYDATLALSDSLPYEPILGQRGKIVAVLGKSGNLRVWFPHNDSYHIIQPSLISRTVPPPPILSFDALIANL